MRISLTTLYNNIQRKDPCLNTIIIIMGIIGTAILILAAVATSRMPSLPKNKLYKTIGVVALPVAIMLGRLFYLSTGPSYNFGERGNGPGRRIRAAPPPPHLLTPDRMEMPEGVIKMGQGEYVAVHIRPDGKVEPVQNAELFEEIYTIFDTYAPMTIITSGKHAGECLHRHEDIRGAIQKLDPTLEPVFISRTFYEMVLIKECLEEDKKAGHICHNPYLNYNFDLHMEVFQKFRENNRGRDEDGWGRPQKMKRAMRDEQVEYRQAKGCWHLGPFVEDSGRNNNPDVIAVAFRLNQVIVDLLIGRNLDLRKGGLTYLEFAALTEDYITYLQQHVTYMDAELKRYDKKEPYSKCYGYQNTTTGLGNPTSNFGYTWSSSMVQSTAIADGETATIVRGAVALDCSKQAASALFVYRGSEFMRDTIEGVPYIKSLPYGNGLFADSLYRGDDSPIHYGRLPHLDCHALVIPFAQVMSAPIYIRVQNTLVDLFSHGQLSLPRSKLPAGVTSASGFAGHEETAHRLLSTDLSVEELSAQMEELRGNAIILKHAKKEWYKVT